MVLKWSFIIIYVESKEQVHVKKRQNEWFASMWRSVRINLHTVVLQREASLTSQDRKHC